MGVAAAASTAIPMSAAAAPAPAAAPAKVSAAVVASKTGISVRATRHDRRGSAEPWSEVPPELEAMLRAQVGQRLSAPPADTASGRAARELDAGAEADVPVTGDAPRSRRRSVGPLARRPRRRGRRRRQPVTRPRMRRPSAGRPARRLSAADEAGAAAAPKRRTTREDRRGRRRGHGVRGRSQRFGVRGGERAQAPNDPPHDGQARVLTGLPDGRGTDQGPSGRARRHRRDDPRRGRAPGAVLLVGPSGIGKTTLGARPGGRPAVHGGGSGDPPVRRMPGMPAGVGGNHPDIHRIGPEGPGRQVVIGGPGKARGVRDLIGGAGVAPRRGWCAGGDHRRGTSHERGRPGGPAQDTRGAAGGDDDRPLRRCRGAAAADDPVTLRADPARGGRGPGHRGDPRGTGRRRAPVAARAARISGGRPGLALAWVRTPDALRDRDAIGRALLDLADARPGERLATVRALVAQAAGIAAVTGLTGHRLVRWTERRRRGRSSRRPEAVPRPTARARAGPRPGRRG